MTENRRVLALFPHPDDMEILCAGTLIRLHALGYEIHVATMTPGDAGSATLPPEEIAAIRREEARRGAEAVGAASYRCLEFRDLQIVFDNPSRRRVTGFLREIDPFLVFTTPPSDYMFDHEITSRLVRDACFNAPIRNYDAEGDAEPSSGVPYLYYTDPIEGVDLYGDPAPVTAIVGISMVIERKADALKCHDSQRSWLQKQHGMDNYIETMRAWSARRGGQIGAAYGEGFRQHRGHPYPHDDLLAAVLQAQQPPSH
ncbi:MAG: PIG-L family deacetylase [Armatimonadetes bacterium]|nr:PIG-L family deacetylase [Armatimonadota bacterium]